MRKTGILFLLVWVSNWLGAQAPDMYYFNLQQGIERSPTDTVAREVVIFAEGINAQGIALDMVNGKIYWTDWLADRIKIANLDGSQFQDLVTTGLQLPEGIALDLKHGKMYWVDSGTNKVQRANLDGTMIEDLITYTSTSVNLDGIALDVNNGKMYWADWGAIRGRGTIRSANLDGTQEKVLVSIPNGILKGIGLDLAAGKMYWTDCSSPAIQRADLNGNNIEDLVVLNLGTPNSLAVDPLNGKMYWTDLGKRTIQRANMDGTQVEVLIADSLKAPEAIALGVCPDGTLNCVGSATTSLSGNLPVDQITLYPNPVEDWLMIDGLVPGSQVLILDQLGKELSSVYVEESETRMNTSVLSRGIYFLKVLGESGTSGAFKIVKQ